MMMSNYNPEELPEATVASEPEKKGRKRDNDPPLTTRRVLKAFKSFNGPVSISEVTEKIYGNDSRNRHGRVNHHIQKLVKDGTLKRTGSSTRPVFQMNDAKPSNTTSTGDLFELVGKIGDALAVRSLDTQQIYKLEEV